MKPPAPLENSKFIKNNIAIQKKNLCQKKSRFKRPPNCPHYPPYDREMDLPKLIPLWPHELADKTLEGFVRVISKIIYALRAERISGKIGHWSYSINRHVALLKALKVEQETLDKYQKNKKK